MRATRGRRSPTSPPPSLRRRSPSSTIDDELIEEATRKVVEVIIEELMDAKVLVRQLMFRVYKYEVAAAAAREAVEAKFG